MRIKKTPYKRFGLAMIGLLSLFQIAIGFVLLLGIPQTQSHSHTMSDIGSNNQTQHNKSEIAGFKLSVLQDRLQQ